MSNLKLVPDAPTPLERMLLDASRAELPSEDHKARLRAALGIGLPLSGPLSSPPPSLGAAAEPAGSGAAAAGAGAAKSATFGKLALGVAVAALVGAFLFTRHATAPVPNTPAKASVVQVAVPEPVLAPVPEPATAVSPLPPVEEAAAAPRVVRTDASSTAVDLSEQIRLIEAARAGVAAHDPKAALAAVDAYSTKFSRGSFGQEAMVLRIRAVDQSGDSARATALAKAFVARFPNSPHVARLKPIAERSTSR